MKVDDFLPRSVVYYLVYHLSARTVNKLICFAYLFCKLFGISLGKPLTNSYSPKALHI